MNISPADGPIDAIDETSVDKLLGGRLRLIQPKGGFRAAVDPLFLAASVPAVSGERVFDVGCGSGAAALCLAVRIAGATVVGLDLQADLIDLARASAELNHLSERAMFHAGDLLDPPDAVTEALFDHVMANPPYLRAGAGNASPDPARALASIEGAADLEAWVKFCFARVRPGGSVTFVHRADRAAEVAALFARAGAASVVLPLGPKRALVQGIAHGIAHGIDQGIEQGGGTISHRPAFTLHQANGAFTREAEAVLRRGAALPLGDTCAAR